MEKTYNLLNNNYNVYIVDKEIQDKSITICKKYDGSLGYADCTSIAVMEELGIHEIVSFDEHFDNENSI
ncbi:PIN domain-containing protein [Methanobrevibacter curvatus]|uniref:PIN domain-containing protein n=1 Tax=Methanobrevibacter curvatus TaxID=49547 RepID=UPI0024818C21|nr:PIN domain-containing protein [Methanobrevibacter curvatus]